MAKLGQKVFLDFTYHLSINTIGNTDDHLCDAKYNLNFDDKWYEHVAFENLRMFGCSVPWHPATFSKNGERIEICRNQTLGAKANAQFHDFHDSSWSKEAVPCAWYDVNLGIPDFGENTSDRAHIRFYLKTKIKQKSIVIYYDSTTFAAEIGGYVGMFLGVSLVDFAIVFDSAFFVMIRRLFG